MSKTETKELPYNHEAEKAVIGAILSDPDAFTLMETLPFPEDFHDNKHALIFKHAHNRWTSSLPIDPIVIADSLKRAGELRSAGGEHYLVDLSCAYPKAVNIAEHVTIIKEKTLLRKLFEFSTLMSSQISSETSTPLELLQKAEQKLFEIATGTQQFQTDTIGSITPFVIDRLATLMNEKVRYPGLMSGFMDMDRITLGFQKSELSIIAARPSVGKTSFITNIAVHMAYREKVPVCIFSMEMSKESITERILSSLTGVPGQELKKGGLTAEAWQGILKINAELASCPLYINEDPNITPSQLRLEARKLVRKHGIKAIFIDYLQLMYADGSKTDNRVQELTKITRQLKCLAKELEIPVIALSQLSRDIDKREDPTPKLSDLRDSGSIEQDADVVIFLSRPKEDVKDRLSGKKASGKIEVHVAKSRNGPTAQFMLNFHNPTTTFTDAQSGGYQSYDE